MKREESDSAWERARAYGCDMALLEERLHRTPAERIQLHQRALEAATMLRQAMEESRAGL